MNAASRPLVGVVACTCGRGRSMRQQYVEVLAAGSGLVRGPVRVLRWGTDVSRADG